tara:strand:+ start:3986 stop:4276 length:291 start_codon:yes stop_codon:yes gene_type:complete
LKKSKKPTQDKKEKEGNSEKTEVNNTAEETVDMISNSRTLDMEGHHNKEIMVGTVTINGVPVHSQIMEITMDITMVINKIEIRVMTILYKNPNQLK